MRFPKSFLIQPVELDSIGAYLFEFAFCVAKCLALCKQDAYMRFELFTCYVTDHGLLYRVCVYDDVLYWAFIADYDTCTRMKGSFDHYHSSRGC